jgi:hypothetical protein
MNPARAAPSIYQRRILRRENVARNRRAFGCFAGLARHDRERELAAVAIAGGRLCADLR